MEDFEIDPADALLLAPAIARGDGDALLVAMARILGGARGAAVVDAILSWRNKNDKVFSAFLKQLEEQEEDTKKAEVIASLVRAALNGQLEQVLEGINETRDYIRTAVADLGEIKVAQRHQTATLARATDAITSQGGQRLNRQLDRIKSQIDDDRPHDALKDLEILEQEYFRDAPNDLKSRILALKGVAKLHLGMDKAAADLLLEAYSTNRDSVRSMQHAALAYSLLKDDKRALAFAEKVLENEPRNSTAIQVRILADSRTDLHEIEAEISAESRLTADALFALGQVALRQRKLDLAFSYFTRAQEESPDTKTFRAMKAQARIESLINKENTTDSLTPVEIAQLSSARDDLRVLWGELPRDDQIRRARLGWLHALTLAEHFTESPDAAQSAEQLTRFDPDNVDFRLLRVSVLAAASRPTEALDELSRVPADAKPDIGLRPALLAQAGRHDEAIALFQEQLNSGRLNALHDLDNFFRTLVGVGRAEEALVIAKAVRDSKQSNPNLGLLAVKCARAARNEEERAGILDDLESYKPSDLTWSLAAEIAREFALAERHSESARFFEPAAEAAPEKYLRSYALQLLQARKYATLFASISEQMKGDVALQEIAIAAHEQLGSIDDALELCERHLSTQPILASILLRYCTLLHRSGRNEELEKHLQKLDLGNDQLSPTEIVNLGILLADVGRPLDALKVYLANLDADPTNEDAHSLYHSAYVRWSHHVPEKATIDLDCGVNLTGLGAPGWIRISANARGAFPGQTYVPTDPLTKALLGKKVGDKVEVASTPDAPWEVSAVVSAFTLGAHIVLTSFSARFPMSGAIQQFAAEKDPADFLDKTERRLRGWSQARENAGDAYARGTIPLSSLGRALSRSPIEAYGAALATRTGLLASPPTGDAQPGELPTGAVVLDLSSILTLSFLVGRPLAELTMPFEIQVTQSTLDELHRAAAELRGIPGERLSMSIENGRLVRYIESEDVRTERLQYHVDQIDWLRANAKVCGVPPENAERWIDEQPHAELFEGCFLDSFLLAGRDTPLVTDDFALRRVVAPRLGVEAMSSMNLLRRLLASGHLSLEDFYERSLRMLAAGYREVPCTVELLEFARADINKFSVAVRGLEGPRVSNESAVAIVTKYLKAEALEPSDLQGAPARLALLLDALTCGRKASAALRAVDTALAAALLIIPLHYRQLRADILAWARAHKLKF